MDWIEKIERESDNVVLPKQRQFIWRNGNWLYSKEWFPVTAAEVIALKKTSCVVELYPLSSKEQSKLDRYESAIRAIHDNEYANNRMKNKIFTTIGKRDGFKCHYCGESKITLLEIDHILAKSRGGSNHIDNLQLLCSKCNMKKGAK